MNTKQKKPGARVFRSLSGVTTTSVASSARFNGVLFDLKNALEALAATGQEVRIHKALIRTQSRLASYRFVTSLVAMVSDQDIVGAAPATASSGNLDEELDVMTAGDYEHQLLATSEMPREDNGQTVIYVCRVSADFTAFAQKFASLMARSAILATNPYGKIVAVGYVEGATNQPTGVSCWVELHYTLHPKPLRMLS